jgi:hypothetical protein
MRPPVRVLLPLILVLAAACRLPALSTYGFSDDEIAKVQAIDSYRRGDFTANAEHPMLMKVVAWGAMTAAERWNPRVGASLRVAPETALRLPNAVAGVLTVVVVYGVAAALFGSPAALIASAFVALDPNIIAINRIGKEDTLLMLFFLAAVFCYERAKLIIAVDRERAQRWFTLSGVGFGLMLASKYMPHFYGLYALFNVSTFGDRPNHGPNRLRQHAAMAAAFVAANVMILSPATWVHIAHYLRGGTLTHHGEMYGNQLYVTNVPVSFAGVPITYYFSMLGTKVPLVILAAALVGVVPLIRRRRERGFVWLRVFLVFLLVGYSVVAAKFQRYALPMMLFIDILAGVGVVTAGAWLARATRRQRPGAFAAALATAAVVMLLADCWRVAPFYSVHQNAIGARLAPPATRFPEEAYDYGIREAVRDIARAAAPGATIVSDTPGIVAYYLRSTGRTDLHSRSLSADGLVRFGEQFVLVQDDHIYFENVAEVARLRRAQTPWRDYRVMHTPVLQVFRLTS